ncbi:S-layer homology domain-containing protein [Pseudoflavonifractor phocaeensis]|uniref:S-layer homology domain-containing protein n=1 Tax=Pseudoflavonifractor phocaeensis TaxID=1870988 RepID=UPI00195E229C|nr:S-layer homology domain-containing protein [Pseudoflavonifractor phocaeensis]MBM6870224.1 S-layer homology domain-containing protein [Pseudoflavonifractor phocaeensis]
MRKQKLIAGLLTAAMLFGLLPGALAAAPDNVKSTDQAKSELGVDLQKSAGSFNTDWETSVKLSISAPLSETPVAVEFVVDTTTSLFSDGQQSLLEAWTKTIYDSMADKNVSVGITIFGSEAKTIFPLTELTAGMDMDYDYADLAWLTAHNGTNVQAGIEAGLADLTSSSAATDNRYLVLITDGGSYWWMDGDTAVNNTANGVHMGNSDAAELDHADDTFQLHSLADLLQAVKDGTLTAAEKNYTSTASEPLSDILNNQIKGKEYTNFEKGVAFAAKAVDEVKAAKVNFITVGYKYYEEDTSLSALTTLANEFITYSDSDAVRPESLESTVNELDGIMSAIYGGSVNVVIPAGTVITDEIGHSAPGASESYNFDLVTEKAFTLYFQDEGAISAYLDENNRASFHHADGSVSELQYHPATNENDTEYFTLTLGRDVVRSNRVDLSYTAVLSTRDTSEGSHVVEPNLDAWVTLADPKDGSLTEDSYLFPDPEMTYRYHYGHEGPGGGGDVTIDDDETPLGPSLNTSDHYAYIIGRDDGYVHPEANITRAEVATIFFRMLTDDSRSQLWKSSNSYPDVEPTDWYNNAISTLTYAGTLTGTPEGVFKPDNDITRAEFATIAVRFFGGEYEGEDLFPDIAGHWANKYINLAATLGLVNGKGDGTFDPDASISRAEAMAIVNRTLGRCASADHLLDDMITWPDNKDTSAWYYADVQEATNSHDMDIITVDNQQIESWTELLPVRDWAALEREWSTNNSSDNPGDVLPETVDPTAGM